MTASHRFAAGVVALCLALCVSIALADDGDVTRATRQQADLAQQFELNLELLAPAAASVELDPANESWAGVEIVRVESHDAIPEGTSVRHIFRVIVAGFVPGDRIVEPAFILTQDGIGSSRVLPPFPLLVTGVLAEGDPLELSPLPGAVSIGGGESPYLRPALYGGAVVAVALLAILISFVMRRLLRRAPAPVEGPGGLPVPDLGQAEQLLDADPVGAYRALAAIVRKVISDQYGVPAASLTAREIGGRMESQGVDRWQARLVSGLLQECEAVVYAGYVPAAERRHADLSMARQIVEGAAP